MKKRNIVIFIAGLLAIFVAFQIFTGKEHNEKSDSKLSEVKNAKGSQSFSTDKQTAESSSALQIENQPQSKNKNVYEGISDIEFAYLKVSLPTPKFDNWKRPTGLTKEKSFQSKDSKLSLLNNLGTFIRLSLRDEPSATGSYLGTLLELLKDSDYEVSTQAVIVLYRLGDYQNEAIDRMNNHILSINEDTLNNYSFQKSLSKILNEVKRENDDHLNQSIYEKWMSLEDKILLSKKNLNVDVYLENKGFNLPVTYWENRVLTIADQDSVDIYTNKKGIEAVATLKSIFDQGSKVEKPIVSSMLYKLTNNVDYLNFLLSEVDASLKKGYGPTRQLKIIFESAIDAHFEKTFPLIKSALNHDNRTLAEASISALEKIDQPEVSDALYESALNLIKQGKLPRLELNALVIQNTPYADNKYHELKGLAMNPNRGFGPNGIWPNNDFAQFEFNKKQRSL
tara:strand:+ start:1452 stop:2810 length:1359 start_codon:yes stop_codon:yes gene_type:complete